jgi:hypothetical protein
MAIDVVVVYFGDVGDVTYPKVDQVIEGAHALKLLARKYPGSGMTDMKHVVSIPYTAMRCWKEVEEGR